MALSGVMASVAVAGEPVDTNVQQTDRQRDNAKTGDPNRVICRRESTIGTRLGSTRRCMTAAEWAAQRQESRMQLERGQGVNPRGSGN